MRVLVTGASGFLGGAIARELDAAGHELGLLRHRSDPPPLQGAVAIAGSLAEVDDGALRAFAPEACVHAAWMATPGAYLQSPENASLVEASLVLAERLTFLGARHLVVLGSCAENAPDDGPDSLGGSAYARAKRSLAEQLLAEGARVPPTSWLRVFHPYGPGEAAERLPSACARALASGETFHVRHPDVQRDFVFVTDVAAAVRCVLASEPIGAADLGTGQPVTVGELVDRVAALVGADPALVVRGTGASAEPPLVADPRALAALGWAPKHDLASGLAQLLAALGLR